MTKIRVPLHKPAASVSSGATTSEASTLQVSESAATSHEHFLNADGLLNVDRIRALQTRIEGILDKLPNTKGNYLGAFVFKAGTRLTKYNASSAKKNDAKYLKQRAVPAIMRKSPNLQTSFILLDLWKNSKKLFPAVAEDYKFAVQAIKKHNTNTGKTKKAVVKVKKVERKESMKEFNAAMKVVRSTLSGAGIKPESIVEAVNMFGSKVVLWNLGGGNIVSIGKSDPKAWRAAKKLAAEQ